MGRASAKQSSTPLRRAQETRKPHQLLTDPPAAVGDRPDTVPACSPQSPASAGSPSPAPAAHKVAGDPLVDRAYQLALRAARRRPLR